MAASPEQKKNYQVVKSFKGMNTRPNRTALENEEFAWLENVQPIGFGNLKVVGTSTTIQSSGSDLAWANSVSSIYSCNINNVDYVVAFEANGGAEYLRLDTNVKGTLASAGTFSASGVRMKQWKNERAMISDPYKGYFTWDAINLISVGSIGSVGITNTGSGYTTPPTVTVSAPNQSNGIQATVVASISNAASTITNVSITSGGTGYTQFPTVTIAAPTSPYGVQAQAVVTSITSGAVTSIQITNPGYGYTTAPAITFSSGSAAATAVVGSGLVTSLTVTNAGSGYTSAPTLSFSGGGGSSAAAVAGPLTFAVGTIGVIVNSSGTGYSSPPTVIFTGGGYTRIAAATAIVFGGIVTGIIVTDPGAGYTSAPAVSFSGGSPTTAATATALLTSNTLSDVAGFQGRVWLSQGRAVFYSAAGEYNDFVSVSAGNIEITDDTLHSNIAALISANNFLYVFGDDSINVFSDVRVTSTGNTLFTNTNVSASNGSIYYDGIFAYFRSLLFINDYGIFALIGATVSKISDALDGIFPLIDFTQPISGGQVLVNNILCAAFNVYYNDPVQGTRPIQLVFFDKKWFVTSQGTIKHALPVTTAKKLYLYGTGGTNLLSLYTDRASNVSSNVTSALWPMQDTIRTKQALKFALEVTSNTTAVVNVTVDSETNTSPTYVLSNIIYWTNNLGATILWTNSSLAVVPWAGGSGYQLYKSDAQQYGKYLGLTITSSTPSFTLNTMEMEYEQRVRF
ncbi:hypothetical protein UFOVP95_6 [uncultured Caudovirales phage]|uniref:Bacteriophage P22, Gp10, DNA-stabilising n=1 Tax=uncultured Caudovirales phage TaxID=2100421 RepID=A0A6J5L2T0_9CAUD|nr:hypothetical protein UFOVP95_6 [uncultured Caudovirales phage]